MSKKILALVLALCMITTVGLSTISASAAIPESPWAALDLEAFAAGTDANWTKGNSGVAVETKNSVTGIVSTDLSASSTETKYTYDPAFIGEAENLQSTKRNWGYFQSKNTITSTDTGSYVVTFDHKMAEGTYDIAHNGLYFYPRTASIGNYLNNRFAIMLRRNNYGVVQVGLKPATDKPATAAAWLNVADTSVDLLDASVRIVDSFETNVIKVYATDSEDKYKLLGTYALDTANSAVTLTNDSGQSLSATAYGSAISATESKPAFLLNEYSGTVSNLVVSYPYTGPQGVTVSPTSGTYVYDNLEIALSCVDEGADIYYTVDGTDPITNEDGRSIYFEGDYIDLNPGGLDLPLDVTLKVVEELNGEYSDVTSFNYKILAAEGSFGINYAEVLDGTNSNWTYGNHITPTTFADGSTYNDAFTISEVGQWTYLGSKFSLPAELGSSVTTFNVRNMQKYADTHRSRGIYLSLKTASNNNMTSTSTPYIVIGAETVGIRMGTTWGDTCTERVPFGIEGLDLSDGNVHEIKFIDDYAGDAYLYIDDNFVAKFVTSGSTLTMTSALGDVLTRDGLTVATDNFRTNVALVHNTATISEINVSYPTESIPGAFVKATIDAEDASLYTNYEEFTVNATTDAGVMYYTVDGSYPTLDSPTTEGTITVPTSAEAGEVKVCVRPYADGVWGIGDTVTYTVLEPVSEMSFDFSDETYLENWGQAITAGGTTTFTHTNEKVVTGSGWTMFNYKTNINSGLTNTIAFDIQDLDANTESTSEDWLPIGVALRHISPSNWFNEASSASNTGIYLFFNQGRLGIRLNNGSYNSSTGFGFVPVDADFTTETRVIIKDAVANNLIGVYVQDPAGTSEPKLIAYLTIDEVDSVPYVSLYSVKDGSSVEDIPYGTNKYSTESFRPTFMANSTPGGYSIDNVTITVNNRDTETIETPILGPVLTEVDSGSDYYKFVEIEASAVGGVEIYYTLDGTEPSKDNGTLYEDGAYVLITKNSTLKAIAYDATYGGSSDVVTSEEYQLTDKEYYQYPFDPAATLAGTDDTWRQGSNNNNSRPSFYVNEDGSFTLDGRNSGDYTGGVGSIWTKNTLTSSANGVVITEFDAKDWKQDKRHMTTFIGMRHGSFGSTSMTDNNLFFIKLYGTQIAFKNETWGQATADYIETGASFDSNSTEFQHYTVIDDKINNVVKILGNGHLLGTFTFSTTTKENDTVTLTTPAGNTATRTYTASVPVNGQVYIGNAYATPTVKNLISYSGTVIPEYDITFETGDFGTIEGESVVKVPKYTAITTVPSVTTSATFEGWSQDGGITVLSADEVAAIVPTGAMTFTAVYSGLSINNFELVPSVVGTSPVFIDSFPLSDYFADDYDVYYTLDGNEPTTENATLWDGKYIMLEETATLKAFATANDNSTAVVTMEITVNGDEYWYDKMDNAAIAAEYGDEDKASTDKKAFDHSSNRAKDGDGNWYAKTLVANQDGSVRIDGKNYGGGTGVSTTYPTGGRWNSDIEKAKTMVYSFDVRNADDHNLGTKYKAMYLGIRVPTDAGFGALTGNKNPQMVLANGKVGMKFGTWGSDASMIFAENVPESMADISGAEWVNITVVDDRTSNVIKVFADGILVATYTVNGADFTMTDVAGKTYTVTYSSEIDADGHFYVGAANYSFDLDNFEIRTGTNNPQYEVTFNVGENGTTTDTVAYTYAKYSTITEVPEVTANEYYTFNGWTIGEETTVYSALDIAEMTVMSALEFNANYTLNAVDVGVSVESVTAQKGMAVKTTVKIDSEVELFGNVTIAYDDSVLTFSETGSSENAIDNGDGTITVNIEASTEETLVFTFKEYTVGATANLQLYSYELAGANDEPIEITTTNGTITVGVLKGDANQNGKIDIYDAVTVLKAVAGIEVLEGDALESADVVKDETDGLALNDATAILKYIARLIQTF